MKELRKTMTEKMIEAIRDSSRDNAIYVREMREKYHMPAISIINERYADIVGINKEAALKVNRDYVIPVYPLELSCWIDGSTTFIDGKSYLDLQDNVASCIMLDGVVRYLNLYSNILMHIPYVKEHVDDAKGIYKILLSVLEGDYHVFSRALIRSEKCDNLDNLCDSIRSDYKCDQDEIQSRYRRLRGFMNKMNYFKNASTAGIVTSLMRDYLPDYDFIEIAPTRLERYAEVPQYVIKVKNEDMFNTYMEKGKNGTATINDLTLVNALHFHFSYTKYLGHSPILETENDSDYIDVNVFMKMRVKRDGYDKLKRIEHHVDYLLDLNSWNEIQSVSDVKVEKVLQNGIDDFSVEMKFLDRESELAMKYMVGNSQSYSEYLAEKAKTELEPDIPTDENTDANFHGNIEDAEKK